MLYKKNTGKNLCHDLFKNPTAEYRGAPFWAWNNKLDKDLLLREIDQMQEMGMGGFHIHCRSGMATEYLGDEFMSLVAACNEKAKDNEMLCWLYDEDRWPSGAAGGIVTKDHQYRQRYLLFEPWTPSWELKNRKLLGIYEVQLSKGFLASYRRLKDDEEPAVPGAGDKDIWIASLEIRRSPGLTTSPM